MYDCAAIYYTRDGIGAKNTDGHRRRVGRNEFRQNGMVGPPENDPATPMLIEAVTVPKLPWIRELVWRPWQ